MPLVFSEGFDAYGLDARAVFPEVRVGPDYFTRPRTPSDQAEPSPAELPPSITQTMVREFIAANGHSDCEWVFNRSTMSWWLTSTR